MFSTIDGENVKEITTKSLDENLEYAYSIGVYDHKALLIDAEKNIIGIPVTFFNGIDNCNRYYLFSYSEENGFEEIGKIETYDVNYYFQFTRAMYIEDMLYTFSEGRIVSAKLSDMKIISSLDLLPPVVDENTLEREYMED